MWTLSKCVSIYIYGVEVNEFWSIGDEVKKGEVSVSDIREGVHAHRKVRL